MRRPDARVILTPEQTLALFVEPTLAQAVCTQVSTVLTTDAPSVRVPKVTGDPSVHWTGEAEEIALSDMTFDEVGITPTKLAGLTVVSSELFDDSTPAAREVIGAGLARDTARKMDEAFFGAVTGPAAQPGLETLIDVTVVDAYDWDNLDCFAEAVSLVEGRGANVTAFVTHPSTALVFAKLKTATSSNVPLLAADPTQSARRIIEGRPLLSSTAVTPGTVWALPADRAFTIVRSDVDVESDRSAFFTKDSVAIRSRMRVGFGFVDAPAVAKIMADPTPAP
ncbi:phage major capsid protein [Kineococcus sp. SYSU DK001]|uniref:phage major capsid protein n=1 Tax=Kineococcus sp. SYSU DK001 TaxID=3383122 RepID=UPI003D7E6ED6